MDYLGGVFDYSYVEVAEDQLYLLSWEITGYASLVSSLQINEKLRRLFLFMLALKDAYTSFPIVQVLSYS